MLELLALFSLQMTLQLSLGNGLVANPEGPIVDRRVPRFSRDQSAREKRKLLTRRLSFGSPWRIFSLLAANSCTHSTHGKILDLLGFQFWRGGTLQSRREYSPGVSTLTLNYPTN